MLNAERRECRGAGEALRVLWLGQVVLRKGIQYLIEAARLLEHENTRFEVVGPIGISETAVKSAPRNVSFHGRATRDQAGDWYRQADLFVLPTVSDGFALTQLEAMAHGLPVIATPNCGRVVTDGVDGLIVPVRDGAALARAIDRYREEPELGASHGAAALRKAAQLSLESLSQRLVSCVGN
jgi:glycosyltransferase involved in cell wall biosynthesis